MGRDICLDSVSPRPVILQCPIIPLSGRSAIFSLNGILSKSDFELVFPRMKWKPSTRVSKKSFQKYPAQYEEPAYIIILNFSFTKLI